jgi:hypothetical protein
MQGFMTGILGRDRIPTTQSLRRRRAQCCLPNSVPGRADLSSIALRRRKLAKAASRTARIADRLRSIRALGS